MLGVQVELPVSPTSSRAHLHLLPGGFHVLLSEDASLNHSLPFLRNVFLHPPTSFLLPRSVDRCTEVLISHKTRQKVLEHREADTLAPRLAAPGAVAE